MKLEDGKTYARADGSQETVEGPTKHFPQYVYTVQGNWYDRETGRYVTSGTATSGFSLMPEGNWRNLVTEVPAIDFTVKYETREQGAIGIFETRERAVTAINPTAALEAARTQLNQEGYETRFPVGVWDASGKRVL